MPQKKTIAFIIHGLSSGGAERVLTSLANHLVDDYTVKIITLIKCDSFYELNPKIKLLNCNSKVSDNKIKTILNHFYTVKRISRFIKTENINLLIGFTTSVNVLSIVSAKLNKIPCIISERNNPVADAPNKFWRILRNYFYKYANYLVVQTTPNKVFFHQIMPGEKVVIITNPIASILASKRILNPLSNKEKIILTVGRLDDNKAQGLLIKAFSNIPNDNWKLALIGDGTKKEPYEKLAEKLNIANKVNFSGNILNVHDYYNSASIFAFTSRSEGFPNALAEALYFGMPSISTNCPHGPSDLIEHDKNGILIDVDDQIMLEKQLVRLMNNDEIRNDLGRAAMESTKKLSIEKVTNEWVKYFNKLL